MIFGVWYVFVTSVGPVFLTAGIIRGSLITP